MVIAMYEIKQDLNKDNLRELLKEFEDTHLTAKKSIVKKLRKELLNSNKYPITLKEETLKQFSKWCNTSGPYSGILKRGGQEVARDISKLLFGKVIARL